MDGKKDGIIVRMTWIMKINVFPLNKYLILVSERLLFNDKWAIFFRYIMVRTSYNLVRWLWWCPIWLTGSVGFVLD